MSLSLFDKLQEAGEGLDKLPPVHLWKPERIYDFDLKIDKEGRWFHEGDEIKRKKLVQLFSKILIAEEGEHFLVTPVEKARIVVEDSALLIVELEIHKDSLVARTNLDDVFEVEHEGCLVLRQPSFGGEVLPYLKVRNGLLARFNRSVFYQAVEQAVEEEGKFFLECKDKRFLIGQI